MYTVAMSVRVRARVCECRLLGCVCVCVGCWAVRACVLDWVYMRVCVCVCDISIKGEGICVLISRDTTVDKKTNI